MRQAVIEVQCSRCDRKETRKYDDALMMKDPPAALTAALLLEQPLGQTFVVTFEDLCGPCHRSVKALLEQVGKRIVGMSPDRPAKPVEKAEKVEKKAEPAVAKKKDQAPPPAPGSAAQPAAPAKNPPPRAS